MAYSMPGTNALSIFFLSTILTIGEVLARLGDDWSSIENKKGKRK